MNQSRDDLVALARTVLRRVYRERTPQALVMSVDPQHGITIHTTPVGVVAPPDGWLLRFEVDPSVLQAAAHVDLLAMLLVDSAIETAEKRRIADQLLADLRKPERLRLPEESDTMSNQRIRDLSRTAEALRVFDEFDATFLAKVLATRDQKELAKLDKEHERLAREVGVAFGLDTDRAHGGPNDPEVCAGVIRPGPAVPAVGMEESFVRRMVRKWKEQQ